MRDDGAGALTEELLPLLAAEAVSEGLAGRRLAVLIDGARFGRLHGSVSWRPMSLEGMDAGLWSNATDPDCLVLHNGCTGPDRSQRAAVVVRLLHRLGARTVLLLDDAEEVSGAGLDVGVIRDHVNLLGSNPLVGPNDEAFGPRFPDMSTVYDPDLQTTLEQACQEGGAVTGRVVVAATSAPDELLSVEERGVWHELEIDAATAGIVPPATVARHASLRIGGLVAFRPLSHDVLAQVIAAVLRDEASA